MKTILLPASILLGAAQASLSGAFVLVDDFSDGNLDGWTVVADVEDPSVTADATVVTDPVNATNQVLSVFPGATLDPTLNLRVYRKIPEFTNEYATFYMRFMQPFVTREGVEVKAQVDAVFGLTSVDEPTAYGDYSTAVRIDFDNSFDIYDGDRQEADPSRLKGYQKIRDEVQQLTGGVWYELWMVVDTFNLTYQLWVKGGPEYPDQTLVYPFGGDTTKFVSWRNTTLDFLDVFVITTSAGNNFQGAKGLDPTYFDDLYVNVDGIDLTSPAATVEPTKGPGVFGNYDVVLGGDNQAWVDTGTWMGWVNVENHPLIYVLDLNLWAYAAGDDKDAIGAWIYTFKPAP
jgi:hypothetical protein